MPGLGVLGIVQARTTSARLPGKVLKPILGRPMILLQLERVARSMAIETIIVATSTDPSDDALAGVIGDAGYRVHRGALDDVLERFCSALDVSPAEHVVRLTGDCPLADPAVIDATIARHLETGADYTSNCLHPSFPDGLDVEVVRAEALRAARRDAVLASEREHVTPFIWKRAHRFRLAELRSPVDRSDLRWTVDTAEDFRFVQAVYDALYSGNTSFGSDAVLGLLAARPDLAALDASERRNEGYARSLATDGRSRPA